MRPLSQRLDEHLRAAGALRDDSPEGAYRRVLWVLTRELSALSDEWHHPRITARRWRDLRARYHRLRDDIRIVTTLLERQQGGAPPPTVRPRLHPPESPYGES